VIKFKGLLHNCHLLRHSVVALLWEGNCWRIRRLSGLGYRHRRRFV